MTTTYKSVHIKECWPYEYVKPNRRVFKQETMDRANARKREVWNEEIYQLGYKTGFREGKQHESQSSF